MLLRGVNGCPLAVYGCHCRMSKKKCLEAGCYWRGMGRGLVTRWHCSPNGRLILHTPELELQMHVGIIVFSAPPLTRINNTHVLRPRGGRSRGCCASVGFWGWRACGQRLFADLAYGVGARGTRAALTRRDPCTA